MSAHETTIFCPQLNTAVTDLTWRFNQAEIIMNRTVGADDLVSDSWRQRVKNVSQSGDLTLQHVSSSQEGTYTCDLSNGEETYVTITTLTVSGETAGGSNREHSRFVRMCVESLESAPVSLLADHHHTVEAC